MGGSSHLGVPAASFSSRVPAFYLRNWGAWSEGTEVESKWHIWKMLSTKEHNVCFKSMKLLQKNEIITCAHTNTYKTQRRSIIKWTGKMDQLSTESWREPKSIGGWVPSPNPSRSHLKLFQPEAWHGNQPSTHCRRSNKPISLILRMKPALIDYAVSYY